MSASTIDAAMASAVETLFGAGTYRQQSDFRQDRERVDPTNVAYQLVVYQVSDDLGANANVKDRLYQIRVTVKKHCADAAAERTWRLGLMATGLETLLSASFYRYDLGELLTVVDQAPEVPEEPELVGRVMRFAVQTTVSQAV